MTRDPTPTLCALVLLLAGNGCQTAPVDEVAPVERPLPYRIYVYVVPLRADDPAAPTASDEPASAAIPVDLRTIEEQLGSISERQHLCTKILVPEKGMTDRATSLDDALDDALKDARDRGADLFIEVDSRSPPQFLFSHNTAWFLPNTLLWFVLGFPSLWISDRVYEIQWPLSLHVRAVSGDEARGSGGTPLATEPVPLSKHVALNARERGFSTEILYTPPGFYDGPEVHRVLRSHAEGLLVDDLVELLRKRDNERIDLSSTWGDGIEITSPRNLSTVRAAATDLRITFRGEAPLLGLRLELDDTVIEARDPISMPDLLRPWRNAAGHVLGRELRIPLSELLKRKDDDPIPVTPRDDWTATKTIRFFTGHEDEDDTDPYELRVFVRTGSLVDSTASSNAATR